MAPKPLRRVDPAAGVSVEESFVMVFSAMFQQQVEHPLPQRVSRILNAIAAEALATGDKFGWIEVNQTGLARELGTHQPHVSSALKILMEPGEGQTPYIERHPKRHGSFWRYRLNPELAWYGRLEERNRMLYERRQRRLNEIEEIHGLVVVDDQ